MCHDCIQNRLFKLNCNSASCHYCGVVLRVSARRSCCCCCCGGGGGGSGGGGGGGACSIQTALAFCCADWPNEEIGGDCAVVAC